MKWSEVWRTGLLPGALAGLVGGLIIGLTMAEMGLLPTIALIIGPATEITAAGVGFILLLVAGAALGAGFGTLVWYQRPGAGETLFWGMVYGAFWWYLGPLTLLPLLQGDGLTWDVASAQAAFPYLLGLVLYGGATGLALVLLRWWRRELAGTLHASGGALWRGGLAGLLGFWEQR